MDNIQRQKPKALILVFNSLKHDARVSRQIGWLEKNFFLTVVCFEKNNQEGIAFIEIRQPAMHKLRKGLLALCLFLRLHKWAYTLYYPYHDLIPQLKTENFDLIFANDIDTAPLAFQLRGTKTKVILDAHEYAPRHFEDKWVWRFFFQPFYIHLCKKYIPQTDGMLTVGKGLALEYQKHFGVAPLVITNAPPRQSLFPHPVVNSIRLVHHGIANPSRKIEWMIELMTYLEDRFTLDLILMTSPYASAGTKAYIENLKQQASQNPRITIHPPVKNTEIVNTIHPYDMGIFLVPPINFNYANTLPNKLFEYIQACLAVAIGPTPSMAEFVKAYNLGVIADEFNPKSLATLLNKLTKADIEKFKQNSMEAAKSLNAESNEIIFNQYVEKIMGKPVNPI